MSPSTARRHARNRELVATWVVPVGGRVTVRRANGDLFRTKTLSDAFLLDGRHAMVQVAGIPGNTALHRVRPGWGALEALP